MSFVTTFRRRSPTVRGWAAALILLAASILSLPAANAQDGDARKILKGMSDYMASLKVISTALETDIEVITPELQKIQFTSSGQLLLGRPDRLRVSRTGGYSDVELVFDGKTLTVHDKHNRMFSQIDVAGSVDELVDRLRDEHGVEAPGADLLQSGIYDLLIADVLDAKHIGRGVIDGVECDHLAFRNDDTDWQIWVEVGPRPVPRKYVITSKTVTGAPQYTLRLRDWKTDAQPPADAFAFKAPAGSRST